MSKRRAAAWAGVAALAAVSAGFMPWPLSPARVADAFRGSKVSSQRLIWRAPQSATFSAFPWPNLRIVDVRLDDSLGVNLISAPAARIDLSLLELLSGRFAPERAVLSAPTVTLDLDQPPFAVSGNLTGVASLAAALEPLAGLNLVDGVVRVSSRARGFDTMVENVQGGLDGFVPGQPFTVNLSATWRNAPIKLFLSLADPVLTGGGAPSAFNAAFSSPYADFVLNGTMAGGVRFSLSGDFSASSTSIAALARLLAVSPPSFLAADTVQIAGKMHTTPTGVTLDEVTATAAGQTVRGAAQITGLGGRAGVSATLDSERIDVAALFGLPPPLFSPNGDWSETRFVSAPPNSFDLDLRLSARRLDIYRHELADAAASAILKDGVLNANLVDSEAFGGRLKGEIRLACVDESLRVTARGELTDADFGAVFKNFGWPAVAGKGSGGFAVRTDGASPAAAASELGGSATLKLEQGSLTSLSLEQALRRSQHRPIDIDRDLRVGETTFDRLSLELALGKGVAHVVNGDLVAQGVEANLQGAIDLIDQSWKLRLNATQTGANGAAALLGLDIKGPWSKPTIRATGAANDVPDAVDPPALASPL